MIGEREQGRVVGVSNPSPFSFPTYSLYAGWLWRFSYILACRLLYTDLGYAEKLCGWWASFDKEIYLLRERNMVVSGEKETFEDDEDAFSDSCLVLPRL